MELLQCMFTISTSAESLGKVLKRSQVSLGTKEGSPQKKEADLWASTALGAITLQVLGAKQMFELWKALNDVSVDDEPKA